MRPLEFWYMRASCLLVSVASQLFYVGDFCPPPPSPPTSPFPPMFDRDQVVFRRDRQGGVLVRAHRRLGIDRHLPAGEFFFVLP